jgi:proteasome lid subunit RPN8/RPN11
MQIRPDVLDAIRAHARREQPRESCGILIGAGDEIIEAVVAANVAEDPHRRYEVSPADHFAQMKRCRVASREGREPLRIVGVYHSHPHSAPVPSPTDLEQAFEEYVYLIAGPADGSAPIEVRGYRLTAGRFDEIALMLKGGPKGPPLRRGGAA